MQQIYPICTQAHLSEGSVNKSYYRSEWWESGDRLGETKKLSLATGDPCRRTWRREGTVGYLKRLAEKSVSSTKQQCPGIRAESREAGIAEKQHLIITCHSYKMGGKSQSSHPPTQRASFHILQD